MAGNIKINKALLPLSWIYGLAVGLRNKLFDWKLLPAEEFSVPVICIGNITVGGTGKTPHTEYLIRLLLPEYKIAVLSRGYKRKTSGYILADEQSSCASIGDEPYQMFRKFPEIIVAVDSNRRRGIRNLLALPEEIRPEVILLDDAFQHRYVKPSLSILLTDSNRLIYEDKLLPAGRLREPAKNKSRAEILIVTKCPEDLKPIHYRVTGKALDLYPYQSLFFTSFRYGNLIPVFNSGESTANSAAGKSLQSIQSGKSRVLLVSGIASPQHLIDELHRYAPVMEVLSFPDHHHFSIEDLKKIKQTFDRMQGDNKLIVTTEKDAVRLLDFPEMDELLKKSLYYLPVEVVFNLDEAPLFNQKIETHVRSIKANSILA